VTARSFFVRFQLALSLLLGSAILCGPTQAAAKVCSAAEKQQADKWLWLSNHDKQTSLDQNLPWGAPVPRVPVSNERQLIQLDYVIGYDSDLRVPLWTAERVVGSSLGKVGRSDCFRKDVRLPDSEASTPADYSEPIFDQGHVTPSADMTVSLIADHNSFIMSNMTPQFCQFNRGVWQILEELVRRWSVSRGTIYVISGSVFDRNNDGARDPDAVAFRMSSHNGGRRVAIPTAFYKVVAAKRPDGSIETLSILLPHDQTDLDRDDAIAYLRQHITNLSQIERLTGLDLLPTVSGTITEDQVMWPYTGQAPRSLARGSVQCAATAGAVIH
jgi:endonuclease G